MDVALIQWPSDDPLRVRLAKEGHPRLLLVHPDADPPICVDLLEDWVRLPVARGDRDARVHSLEQRAGRPGASRPVVSDDGTIEYAGEAVELSGTQQRVVAPLIDRFGAVVSRDELITNAWPGVDASSNNLDVTVGRLRRQVERVGLRIRTVRSRGYLLCPIESER